MRTDAGAEPHIRAVDGAEGQEQLWTPFCSLPVPADDEGDAGGAGEGTDGVQQGALQGGILPDSHLHGDGRQGGGTLLPPETFNTAGSSRVMNRITRQIQHLLTMDQL